MNISSTIPWFLLTSTNLMTILRYQDTWLTLSTHLSLMRLLFLDPFNLDEFDFPLEP